MYSLHKISVSILFVFLSLPVSGSDPYLVKSGAAEAGMNYSCITKTGFWSSFHNQALLPFNTSICCGTDYQNRFNINELSTSSVAIVVPVGNACIGAIYHHFGYKDLKRHSIGVSCGLRLSEKISAGIQTDLFAVRTPAEYADKESVTFEAGMMISPSDNIKIGIHIFNPMPNSLRKTFIPSAIRTGAGISLTNSLFVSAETEISTGKNLNIKAGLEYEPAKNLMMRGGFSSENTSFSFGIGYKLKNIQLDFGFLTHELLGVTSCASVIFKFY